ncbi:MAG: sodium-dependent transporter [Kiritimatiellia bacterium]
MEGGKRASWSGQMAFVLASAASAIGLGNLWRFPYLAAQYGGGIFLVVYLLLVVTLGFTLMLTEIALGRKTQQSQLTAYARLRRGWGFVGCFATVVPILIVPYYCVIGGWVMKYFTAYAQMAFTGAELMGAEAADADVFFSGFIGANFAPFGYGLVFIFACAAVIVLGVKNGIEKSNLVLMPILFGLAIAISVYVVCLPGSREGVRYYLVPNMGCLRDADGNFSLMTLGKTILGAMGQMFYSLSLAMGIMVTYGSYMKKSDPIEKSVRRIELFDTFIALVAGLMIIPVVYMFAVKTGTPVREAMNAGPRLMFVTLPKVFAMLGPAGNWLGLAFFALVIFAAATSAISLYEACVAAFCDILKLARNSATLFVGALICFLSVFSALGFGVWGDIRPFGMDFLSFFDFTTSCVLMPVSAVLTCIFVGWVLKPAGIIEECEAEGHVFKAKGFYAFLVKYVAPAFVLAILVSEICRRLGIGDWSI